LEQIKHKDADAIVTNNYELNDNHFFDDLDHDYYSQQFSLEEYVVDIVKYTSGFIVRKIRSMKNICAKCDAQLTEAENEETSSLLKFKHRGMLLNAS